jgi:membrane protease YdiL (CAAX protease family)
MASFVSLRTQRITAAVLFGIAALQAIPLVFAIRGLDRLYRYPQSPFIICAVLVIAGLYVAYSARHPGIRQHIGNVSWLRIPAVLVAVTASIVEEFYFRHVLMDVLQRYGIAIVWQVLASGFSFGLFHAMWGVWGGWPVVRGAITATTGLGIALALLYLLSGRHLAAPIEAHFLVDLILEPALVIFAVEAGANKRGGRLSGQRLC